MPLPTLKDVNVSCKRVLLRVDFNVPLDTKGNVADDSRIRAALPTLNYLLKNKAIVIIISHLGRPAGVEDRFRMNAVAARLEVLLGKPIQKADDVLGADVDELVKKIFSRKKPRESTEKCSLWKRIKRWTSS